MAQRKVNLPPWLDEMVVEEVEKIFRGKPYGRSWLIGIWHASLALYFSIPEKDRISSAYDMQIEAARKESIEAIASQKWPYSLIRTVGEMSAEDRDALIEALKLSPTALIRTAKECRQSIQEAAESLERPSGSSRVSTTSSGTPRKPKRGRPPKK